MDIGFIGLGNMGYPMARRLIEAGHKLVVYDTSGQMMSRMTSLGAVAAKSARDVADQVETVMASLPTPDIVLAVATGKDGVIEGKRVSAYPACAPDAQGAERHLSNDVNRKAHRTGRSRRNFSHGFPHS